MSSPFDHLGRDVGQNVDEVIGLRLEGHGDGLNIQKVSEQHRDVGAPARMDRVLTAPERRVVDDVVMDQAGGVDDLDERRPEDMVLAFIAAQLRAEHQQSRPDALAALFEKVSVDLGDEGIGGAPELFERAFDGVEVALDRPIDVVERHRFGRFGHGPLILALNWDFFKRGDSLEAVERSYCRRVLSLRSVTLGGKPFERVSLQRSLRSLPPFHRACHHEFMALGSLEGRPDGRVFPPSVGGGTLSRVPLQEYPVGPFRCGRTGASVVPPAIRPFAHSGRGPGHCPGVHFRRTRPWLQATGEWRAEGSSLDFFAHRLIFFGNEPIFQVTKFLLQMNFLSFLLRSE